MVAVLRLEDRLLRVINIHNAALNIGCVRRVVEFLIGARNSDGVDPLGSASILIGDLNLKAPGERRFKAGRPVAASLREHATTSSFFENLWMRELKCWIEISQPFPTNYSASGDSCARIDRVFTSIPTSHLLNLKVSSSVVGTPEDNEANCISDHAALEVSFSLHITQQSRSHTVPRHICKHPVFSELISQCAEDLQLTELPVHLQMPMLKAIIFESARKVRDYLITHDSQGVESQRLVISSVARAVWRQDYKLANRLINSSPLALSLLGVSGSSVFLLDPPSFDNLFNETRHAQKQEHLQTLQSERLAATSINAKKQIKSRIQGVRRMLALFWPSRKNLKLSGIRLASGETFQSPQDVQTALKDYWTPVYSDKPFDADAANKFFESLLQQKSAPF